MTTHHELVREMQAAKNELSKQWNEAESNAFRAAYEATKPIREKYQNLCIEVYLLDEEIKSLEKML